MSRNVGVIGRLCNVIGILSFFLSGARVTDPGLQEIGDFAEIFI